MASLNHLLGTEQMGLRLDAEPGNFKPTLKRSPRPENGQSICDLAIHRHRLALGLERTQRSPVEGEDLGHPDAARGPAPGGLRAPRAPIGACGARVGNSPGWTRTSNLAVNSRSTIELRRNGRSLPCSRRRQVGQAANRPSWAALFPRTIELSNDWPEGTPPTGFLPSARNPLHSPIRPDLDPAPDPPSNLLEGERRREG